MSRTPPIPYGDAELAFLESRKATPRRELHAEFVETFGRDDVSFNNLKALMKRRSWLTGRTGAFEKGQEAWNLGKKMPFNANSARTRFKKGQVPQTYRGPGHERFDEHAG